MRRPPGAGCQSLHATHLFSRDLARPTCESLIIIVPPPPQGIKYGCCLHGVGVDRAGQMRAATLRRTATDSQPRAPSHVIPPGYQPFPFPAHSLAVLRPPGTDLRWFFAVDQLQEVIVAYPSS